MSKNNNSLETFGEGTGKNKGFIAQQKTIFTYLSKHIATATMVSVVTGIPQKSICRYKKNLENLGLLKEVERKLCKVTGHLAYYLTTDKNLFKSS